MTSNSVSEIEVLGTDAPSVPEPSTADPNVASGLEPLIPLSVVFVKQKVDMLEAYLGTQEENKYAIFDQEGQMLYIATEYSEPSSRLWFGPSRAFKVNITDQDGRGILCDRPRKLCLDMMTVTSLHDGQVLGTIKQQFSCCSGLKFKISDDKGNAVFIIKAPYCTDVCCGDVQFDVYSTSSPTSPVGRIAKLWSGWGQDMLTNADNFGVSFPVDLAVNLKAVLLGTSILMDFAFFEEKYSLVSQDQVDSNVDEKHRKHLKSSSSLKENAASMQYRTDHAI